MNKWYRVPQRQRWELLSEEGAHLGDITLHHTQWEASMPGYFYAAFPTKREAKRALLCRVAQLRFKGLI